jgi:hypothetical protein
MPAISCTLPELSCRLTRPQKNPFSVRRLKASAASVLPSEETVTLLPSTATDHSEAEEKKRPKKDGPQLWRMRGRVFKRLWTEPGKRSEDAIGIRTVKKRQKRECTAESPFKTAFGAALCGKCTENPLAASVYPECGKKWVIFVKLTEEEMKIPDDEGIYL